jgi:hypothetical protein
LSCKYHDHIDLTVRALEIAPLGENGVVVLQSFGSIAEAAILACFGEKVVRGVEDDLGFIWLVK